jgi:hypothetical protein
MEILTRRNETFTKGYTAGQVLINGEPFCYCLEDEVREIDGVPVEQWKIKGVTAIPRGRYRVLLTYSPKFGRVLPELLNVPGYSKIRSHSGNKAEHTEGCILVGMDDGNPDDGWNGNSKKAEGLLMNKIREAINCGDEVWWTVEGGGKLASY